MNRRPRCTHSAAFKAKGALSAVRGDKTLAELAQQYDVHPHQITDWKNQWLARAADVFGGEPSRAEPAIDLKALHAKIGQLALENDFLEDALIKCQHAQHKAMIVRNHGLPIRCQTELVNISRCSLCYRAKPVSDDDLKLMRCMAISALYRKPNTSEKTLGRAVYLHLLRTLAFTRAHPAWVMDISYTSRWPGVLSTWRR